jgi:hypothetical protein
MERECPIDTMNSDISNSNGKFKSRRYDLRRYNGDRGFGKRMAQVRRIIHAIDLNDVWIKLLQSDDERIRLETAKYLWDRGEGKPYISTNPAAAKARVKVEDNRLQLAIQQFIMPPAKTTPAAPKLAESVQSELPEDPSCAP